MATEATLALTVDASGAIMSLNRFDRAIDSSRGTVTNFVQNMKRDMEIVAAAAGGAVVAFTAKAVGMASQAQEIRSKFNVVFRGMEEDARKWATGYGDAVGRSTIELEKHMAGLGDVFKPLGYSAEDALRLSKAVTSLATDVASFSNAADANVIRDFTSAMVGNTETVRKYGIVISEGRLEQESYAQGLRKQYKDLTDLEKVTLRFAIIQKSSTDAVGDAIRTADSYANQMKRAQANVHELGVELGDRLLPAANKALMGLNTLFTDNRSAINRWAKDFEDGVKIVTGAMDSLYAKAFSQSDIKTMFESFGPWKQESILKAYESHTGGRFGWQNYAVPGIMGGAAGRYWRDPGDEEYARRLIESYARQTQKRNAGGVQPAAPGGDGASALDIKGLLGTSAGGSTLGSANTDAVKQVVTLERELQRELEIIGRLDSSHERAAKMVEYETAVRAAYADSVDQQNKSLEEYRKLLNDLERQQKLVTLGNQVGDAWGGAFEDMVLGAKTAAEAFEALGLEISRSILRQMVTEKISRGASDAFIRAFTPTPSAGRLTGDINPAMANVAHNGWDAVGYGPAVTRAVNPSMFGFAPRLHSGLEPDEFPAILQRGERVQSVAEVRAGRLQALPTPVFNVTDATSGKTQVQSTGVQFDGKRLIVGMVLKDRRNNGPMTRGTRRR
jgi:hypothetical protein